MWTMGYGECTTSDVARATGLSTQTVQRACDRGLLKHRKWGRYRILKISDVLKFCWEHEIPCLDLKHVARDFSKVSPTKQK